MSSLRELRARRRNWRLRCIHALAAQLDHHLFGGQDQRAFQTIINRAIVEHGGRKMFRCHHRPEGHVNELP